MEIMDARHARAKELEKETGHLFG